METARCARWRGAFAAVGVAIAVCTLPLGFSHPAAGQLSAGTMTVCPPDAAEGKFDPVKQKAIDLGVPVHQHKSMKKEQAEVG